MPRDLRSTDVGHRARCGRCWGPIVRIVAADSPMTFGQVAYVHERPGDLERCRSDHPRPRGRPPAGVRH